MKLLSTLTFLSLFVITSAHASSDGAKRPSYCKEQVSNRISMGIFEARGICTYLSNREYMDQNFIQACGDMKKQYPDATCTFVGQATVVACTGGGLTYTQKYEVTRGTTQEEAVALICRSVTNCMTQAFNRDDRDGIDWANDMSNKLGCK
jgi:hypothetical protein